VKNLTEVVAAIEVLAERVAAADLIYNQAPAAAVVRGLPPARRPAFIGHVSAVNRSIERIIEALVATEPDASPFSQTQMLLGALELMIRRIDRISVPHAVTSATDWQRGEIRRLAAEAWDMADMIGALFGAHDHAEAPQIEQMTDAPDLQKIE
jgi:hypothetical protein